MADSLLPKLRAGSFLVSALILAMGSVVAMAAAPAAPAHYTLDPARSMLRFSFVQAGANNTGRFGKFTTDVLFATDNLPASKINVTVDVGSLDTGDKERDDSLKGADLFDVSKFPAYGRLSRLSLEGQEAGARVEVNPEKRGPFGCFRVTKFEEAK